MGNAELNAGLSFAIGGDPRSCAYSRFPVDDNLQ